MPAKRTQGTATRQNLVMPTDADRTPEIDTSEGGDAVMAEFARQLHDLQGRVTAIETQQGAVALHMPRLERPLTRTEVEEIIQENSGAEFEVLNEPGYRNGTFRMIKGKTFSVRTYANIPAHVGNGLKLIGVTKQ